MFLIIAFRNIFRNIRRSILCIVAISLAVLLIVFFMAYVEGMLESAKIIAQTFESSHIQITTKEYDEKKEFYPLQYPITNIEELTKKLESIDGINKVTSRITTYATFTNNKVKHGFVSGVNFDEIKESSKNKVKYSFYNYTKKNDGLVIGRFPDKNKNEAAIGYRLAKKMELVPPIIEKYEFEFILENINDSKNIDLFKSSYKYDNKLSVYKLNLFQTNDIYKNGDYKLSKQEIKKITQKDKEKYLGLLNILMNLEIKKTAKKIGKNANIFYYLEDREFYKEPFLNNYTLDNGLYTLNDDNLISDKMLLKIFNSAYALRTNFKILSSQYSDMPGDPKIVGIFDYDYLLVDENFILIPINKMERLASIQNEAQSLYLFVDDNIIYDNKKLKDVKNAVISTLNNPDLNVKDWTEFPFIAMFKQYDIVYFITYSIFIIVASFLIINTVIMVIHERIKEIGMMGSLGMKRIEVIIVFFLEALILSILGALGGTLLGGISSYIGSLFPISMEALTGGVDMPVTNTIFIKFSWIILVKGFLYGTVITSICTIFPSLKSAFIEPVEALRR